MREFEPRHLEMVRAIAQEGSLSHAAVRLGVSRPALTTQLQRVERHIGGMLFERHHDGVRTTELGACQMICLIPMSSRITASTIS